MYCFSEGHRCLTQGSFTSDVFERAAHDRSSADTAGSVGVVFDALTWLEHGCNTDALFSLIVIIVTRMFLAFTMRLSHVACLFASVYAVEVESQNHMHILRDRKFFWCSYSFQLFRIDQLLQLQFSTFLNYSSFAVSVLNFCELINMCCRHIPHFKCPPSMSRVHDQV